MVKPYHMSSIQYFNGQFVTKDQIHISIDNVGFLRGYGVFEFFKVYGDQPLFMEDHLNRLFQSAEGLNMDVPLKKEELKSIVHELIARNKMDYSSMKIILTGGSSEDGFTPGPTEVIIMNAPFADPSEQVYRQGASLMLYEYQRDFPKIKSLYYTTTVALQPEWKGKGHIDVLYHDGHEISEVSRSNVFIFKQGMLKTNQAGVLGGVTRLNVLKAASTHFEIEIGAITLEELLTADEVFITSTSKKVLPIVKLDDTLIGNGMPGPKTVQLIQIFEDYIKVQLKS